LCRLRYKCWDSLWV